MLDADPTDLLVALGEAAREHSTGVILLLDEIQLRLFSSPRSRASYRRTLARA
ncbi:MAG: hypothetical protein WEB03_14415 [Nitriliruptor sp.]|uniref:hypothetical protein n=1 Tax=Nitriliruptor sp. TaxID=2448056 RepID=UPI0034A08773